MEPAKKIHPRLVVLAVVLLFVVPILVSWAMVASGWRPGGTTNHGHLLQPPDAVAEAGLMRPDGAPVAAADFNGYWTVLVAQPTACEDDCRDVLGRLERVHVALNKDMDRVRFALLMPQGVEEPRLPETVRLLRAAPEAFARLASARGEIGVDGPTVHVVDPRGWLIMAYPYPLDASGLLKDLRRLLRASDEEIERIERPGEEV